jgi:hypothetical protein
VELSVFIGPVLFYLIWRYRRAIRAELPTEMKWPIVVVSLVSIWLGMGSLHLIGIPVWLSPFDWLRPLPGFRSLDVTGRYWGFLTLPLSLLAAVALWRFIHCEPRTRHSSILIASALVMQLTFQGQSLLTGWRESRPYTQASLDGLFSGKLERVMLVENPATPAHPHEQGEFITPIQAVVNCYDRDDFTRADVQPGNRLIKAVRADGADVTGSAALDAGFLTWSHIRILQSAAPVPVGNAANADRMLHIVLNQAYHTRWSSSSCALTRGGGGNLVANCPANKVQSEGVDLTFFDPVSELGARVSLRSLAVLSVALALFGLMSLVPRRRTLASPGAAR